MKKYDCFIFLYHDQALIPFKYISQFSGVNYTGNLSIIRVSPDHGTAYDIVGQDKASGTSMRNAIYTAIDVYRNRQVDKEIKSNPLQNQKTLVDKKK